MKCCSCKQEKDTDKFPWRNRSTGTRQSYCRECKKAQNRSWYQKHRREQLKRVVKNRKVYVAELRALVSAIKDVPCMDCGIRWPPVAMDFDHVQGEKVASVSQMVNWNNPERVRAEIAKCEIVCACCHRIRTEIRRKAARDL